MGGQPPIFHRRAQIRVQARAESYPNDGRPCAFSVNVDGAHNRSQKFSIEFLGTDDVAERDSRRVTVEIYAGPVGGGAGYDRLQIDADRDLTVDVRPCVLGNDKPPYSADGQVDKTFV